jgi:hypothetical protein
MDDYRKTKSGEFFKAMQDVKRKAAAEMRGSKAVEGDTLDYSEWLKPKSSDYEKEIDYNDFKKKKVPVEGDTLDYSQFGKKPKPVEGDTLNYKDLKKQYLKKAMDEGSDISRSGIKALKKGGSKLLSGIPIVGSLAALAGAEDASAAVPILDSAESAGMSPEAENQFIAEQKARNDYMRSPAAMDRMAALEKLKKNQ